MLRESPEPAGQEKAFRPDSPRSWMIALLSHLTIFSTWGFVNAFGVFQTYYVRDMRIGDESAVAWIGSTQLFLLFCTGVLSGHALDAGYYRAVFVLGSVTYLVGVFALSACRGYWQVFLAHAVCIGVGFGAVFSPTVALTGTYFQKHKSLALGLVTIGSATGGMAFAAIAAQMMPKAGFAWTVRTMGFLQLGICVVCCIFLKPHTPPRQSGSLIEWSALRHWPYSLTLVGAFFLFWAVYLGFYFIGSYGRGVIGVSPSAAVYLLLTMNGVGALARVLASTTTSRYGSRLVIIPTIVLNALLGYCWIALRDERGLWAFTVAYGIVAAMPQAMYSMVLGSFSSDPQKAGAITGMGFFVAGIAALTGPPIAGALIRLQQGGFLGVQILSGSSMVVSAAFFAAARWVDCKTKDVDSKA
ncbi:major facilitator superfamily transporter [Colletotrichum plurivorum]|uniref:Major facilitator superfamily transporter n=1 Tax=Colletotrichum plurivorum TaxID=2175906 RepID=A0A8H6JRM1_9PEZI|nr:major facilitator superfamily transporter [Colletotrichum plurivorum]